MGWKEGLTAEIWGTAMQDLAAREGACFAQKAETVPTGGQGRGRLEKPLWLLGGAAGVQADPTHSEPQFLLRAVGGARAGERDT